MKRLLLLLVLLPAASLAQWDGQMAKVKVGGIGCATLGWTEEMYWFGQAGNTQAQEVYISSKKCVKFDREVGVTVVKDASTFTDPEQAQVMILFEDGDTIRLWFLMEDLNCCFTAK